MALSEEDIEKVIKAGKIAFKVKSEIKSLVRPGMKYVDLATAIEDRIRSLGGEPAFPCNISIGEEAAHYTPLIDDSRVVPDTGVLKVDIGVHVDGYLADTSVSIDLSGENEMLIQSVEEALEKALELVSPGTKVSAVGEVIEKTIKYYGFKPIRNLTGHAMERYRLHTGFSIPNTKSGAGTIKPGMLLAIEPFATTGIGYVVDGAVKTIFSFSKPLTKRKGLNSVVGSILERVYLMRKSLPFTERWYVTAELKKAFREALSRLEKNKTVIGYPVLVESSGQQVAQAEDTILVLEKETIITTRW